MVAKTALTQRAPLLVSVDQHTTLVEHAVEQQRRARLHLLQKCDVDVAIGDSLQASAQPRARQRLTVSERHEKIDVGAGVLVTACEGAVEHRKADVMLGPQSTAKARDDRPVRAQVLALAVRESKPPRPEATGMQGALRSRATQRALLHAQIGGEFL